MYNMLNGLQIVFSKREENLLEIFMKIGKLKTFALANKLVFCKACIAIGQSFASCSGGRDWRKIPKGRQKALQHLIRLEEDIMEEKHGF